MPVDIAILQQYIDAGKRIFPVTAYNDITAEEKYRGKKPKIKDWRNAPATPQLDPAIFRSAEAGMALDPDDLIIDVDPRNGGNESLEALSEDVGHDLESLAQVIVYSGRNDGGRHLYFKRPSHTPIRKNLQQYPGIDFLSDKNYVVTAGSRHASTGQPYQFGFTEGTFKDIKHAPSALLDMLVTERPSDENQVALTDWNSNPADISRAENEAQTFPPAIQGNSGDHRTFQFFCRMHDIGLAPKIAFKIFKEKYNPRCEPPWALEEAAEKLRNAYTYAREGLGNSALEKIFSNLDEPANDQPEDPDEFENWKARLHVDKNGKVKDHLPANADVLLHYAPAFRNVFMLNEFDKDIYLMRKPPWEAKEKEFPPQGRSLTENDITACRSLLGEKPTSFHISEAMLMSSIRSAAGKRSDHPVRAYLSTLTWDGTPRVENWLTRYAGVADNAYTREAGKLTLVAAIARVQNPGCKFDYMLVLEGEQGIGKSTLAKILSKGWFDDGLPDVTDKDAIEQLRGRWVVEIAEMTAVGRADARALKAFLSRSNDRARLAYARRAEDYPRQCIFIGTTNEKRYLRDTTRNRRFWPIHTTQVDFAALERDVDQLWAEAQHIYDTEKPELYLKGEAAEIAEREQGSRLETDPWVEQVQDYTDGGNYRGEWMYRVSPIEIARNALNIRVSTYTQGQRSRLADVMRMLEWQEVIDETGRIFYVRPQPEF